MNVMNKKATSGKNKTFLMLFIPLFLLLFISCPQEMVKGTIWVGTYTGADDNLERTFELIFKYDGDAKVFMEWGDLDNRLLTAVGEYSLNDADTFIADDMEGSGEFGENTSYKIFSEYFISLDGVLNNSTGIGRGTFDMRIVELEEPYNIYKGDWKLTKLN